MSILCIILVVADKQVFLYLLSGRRMFGSRTYTTVVGLAFCATFGADLGSAQVYSVTPIPQPAGWTYSRAQGINDSGQIVGWGGTDPTSQAFIATAAGITLIPLPAGWSSAKCLRHQRLVPDYRLRQQRN
jgi:hypothetical protein